MATRKPDARQPGVVFSKPAAERIASAVRTVERMSGADSAGHWPYRGDEPNEIVEAIKLGRTGSDWPKGTSKLLTIYDSGTPLNETQSTPPTTVTAHNKFADVAAGKWVMVSLFRGEWYLTAAEC